MKPLLIYVTFNRMGTTVKSLSSILSDCSDFEMIIVDNDSRDKTRDYLRTLTDPRIKEIKFFDQNIGAVQAANYGISKRKYEQDIIFIENDCNVLTRDFVNKFIQSSEVFNADQVHARIVGLHDEDSIFNWNGENGFLESSVFGLCYYMKSRLIERIGFYCESANGGDVDFNNRILRGVGSRIGYTSDVKVKVLQPNQSEGDGGWGCSECLLKQNVCSFSEKECLKFYPSNDDRLHGLFWENRRERMYEIINKRIDTSNLKAGSIHLNGSLNDSEVLEALENREFFSSYYESYLKKNGLYKL